MEEGECNQLFPSSPPPPQFPLPFLTLTIGRSSYPSMDTPLPTTIPLSRVLLIISVILTLSSLLTWQLTYSAGKQSRDFPYSTLYEEYFVDPVLALCNLLLSSDYRKIECPSVQPSFATLDSDGFLTIAPPLSTITDYSNVKCSYSSLSSDHSNGFHLDPPIPIKLNSRHQTKDEQFVVRCSNSSGQIMYEEAFVNIKNRLENTHLDADRESPFKSSNESSPSLSILLLDPMSRSQFVRHFPKTVKLMTQSDFFVPSRYSQYFTSSQLNLDLLLNGEEKESLLDLMKARRCLTFLNEEPLSENDNSSLFSSSSHLSTRPFNLFNKRNQQTEHCLSNGKSRIRSILSPLVDFSSSFSSVCHFSLTRLRSPSLPSLLSSMDDHLSEVLIRFLSSPASGNTSLFIISPSGAKGNGLVGEVEGKSPLMSAWFPLSFRKLHNPHYSTFSYNMDKLLTTRDIRETLRHIVNGSYEDIVKRDPDMEQSEMTSLLTERLPEYRNCSIINIPDENCLCMGSDERRNETLNQDYVLFDRVFDLLTSRLMQEPCIQSTEIRKNGHFVDTYQLNSTVYGDESDDIEWLTIRFYAKLAEGIRASSPFIVVEGTVRHYISTSRLEYVDSSILQATECLSVKINNMCSMCYSPGLPILSIEGPTAGFLLDLSSESLY